MRVIGAVGIMLLALGTAAAQTPNPAAKPGAPKPAAAPKPATNPPATASKPAAANPAAAKPAAPKPATTPSPNPVQDFYTAMSAAERMALQSHLVWSGEYNGLINGEYSDRLVAAVKAFQARNKSKQTGILNPQERAILAAAAKAPQDQVGWRMVDDSSTGARLGLPLKLAPQPGTAKSGSRWSSQQGQVQIETFRLNTPGTTLSSVFEDMKQDPIDRKVQYQVHRPDFFVISGLQGLKKFYVRASARDNDIRGITILYDQAMEGIMDAVVVAMSSAFTAFPATPVPPAPRRSVEYSTGIVVTSAGHIITDRQMIDGCQTIVLPGLGNPERLAEDNASDLALLRVYGAHDLKPVTLARGPSRAASVSLVGILEPRAQAGGGTVSTVSSSLGNAGNGSPRPLIPAPTLGFSGAAAYDNEGRFAGMVQLKPTAVAGPAPSSTQAVVVPADAIRRFLENQNVLLTEQGSDDPKASVVRVICVTK